MAGNNKHVVFKDGAWKIKGEGSQRSSGNFKTQREAIERAREIAINQRCEVVIHRPDGRIRDKDSYGNDPCPPKDKRH